VQTRSCAHQSVEGRGKHGLVSAATTVQGTVFFRLFFLFADDVLFSVGSLFRYMLSGDFQSFLRLSRFSCRCCHRPELPGDSQSRPSSPSHVKTGLSFCTNRGRGQDGGRNTGRQGRQPNASYRSVSNGPLPLVADFVKKLTILDISNTVRILRRVALSLEKGQDAVVDTRDNCPISPDGKSAADHN